MCIVPMKEVYVNVTGQLLSETRGGSRKVYIPDALVILPHLHVHRVKEHLSAAAVDFCSNASGLT
jgi:hypothetical protein